MPGRRSRHYAALVAMAIAVSSLFAAPAAPAGAASLLPVMGRSSLSAAQLATWYANNRGSNQPRIPALNNDVAALAQIFINEGAAEGVRGDIAFVQSMVETGWLSFPSWGQIPPDAYNYAGIRAYDGRAQLTTCAYGDTTPSRCFGTPQNGVRMQIQLLRSYADPSAKTAPNRLISAPSDRAGMATYWDWFGWLKDGVPVCPCGKLIWASSGTYGTKIVSMYTQALGANGVSLGDGSPAAGTAAQLVAAGTTFDCIIRSKANGKYVSAEMGFPGAEYGYLVARAWGAGAWEKFTCENRGGSWSIVSRANSRYVSAELGYPGAYQGVLRARATTPMGWEMFTFTAQGTCASCFAVRGANGRYLSAELGYPGRYSGTLRARSDVVGEWENFEIIASA